MGVNIQFLYHNPGDNAKHSGRKHSDGGYKGFGEYPNDDVHTLVFQATESQGECLKFYADDAAPQTVTHSHEYVQGAPISFSWRMEHQGRGPKTLEKRRILISMTLIKPKDLEANKDGITRVLRLCLPDVAV